MGKFTVSELEQLRDSVNTLIDTAIVQHKRGTSLSESDITTFKIPSDAELTLMLENIYVWPKTPDRAHELCETLENALDKLNLNDSTRARFRHMVDTINYALYHDNRRI